MIDTTIVEPDPAWRADLRVVAGRVSSGVMAGMACGAIVAGLGGRIAMFVLRLTSDNSIRGLETDDGFEIGSITTSTLFLLFFTVLLGAFGGVLYLVGRRFVPERRRVIVSAALFGVLGSTAVLKPGKFDFRRVEPHALAVIFFIVIPIAFGALLPVVAERWLARDRRPWFSYLPILLLGFVGPILVGFALVVLLGFTLVRAVPAVRRVWQSSAVTWLGRGALTIGFTYGAWVLVDEVTEIL